MHAVTRFSGFLFLAFAAGTAIGAAALASSTTGPIAGNPTLHAAIGLAWLFSLWASLAVFMVFMGAWVVEGLNEEALSAHTEPKRTLKIVPSTPRQGVAPTLGEKAARAG